MATIQMSAQQVIDAAIKTIASIENTRRERDEKSIASVMAVTRGWFKKYHYTRDQAITWLGKQDVWGWHSMYAWGDHEKAKALLKLAQHGDPVTLNEEDVRVLF